MASVQSQLFSEEKPLDSYRDDLESEDFVGKVSKFEFLAHNATSPTSSTNKKRWALFEGMRFPSNDEQITSTKPVNCKPPLGPSATKTKQGPPTPPKPMLYQNLSSPPLKTVQLAKSPSPVMSGARSPSSPSPSNQMRNCSSPCGSLKRNGRMTPILSPKFPSQEDLAICESELQEQCQKMKEARLQEQELEQQEQQRLQEILNMCADYERQLVIEKQQIIQQQSAKHQHTGIKTNGSLPRDTPPINCSSDGQSPTPNTSGRSLLQSTSSETSSDEMSSNTCVAADRLSNDKRAGSDLSNESREQTITPILVSTRSGIKTVATTHRTDLNDEKSPDGGFHYVNGNRNPQSALANKQKQAADGGIEKKNSEVFQNERIFLSLSRNRTTPEASKKDQLKQLKLMKIETENSVGKLRKQIRELEVQESEILTEYELEKALLEGERQTQLSDILDDENRLDAIKHQEGELMNDNVEIQFVKNEDLIENSKRQLELLQSNLNETTEKLKQCEENGIDVEEKETLKNFLTRTQENLEAEKKVFEDLEFQKLEYEAHREEERETLQHRLNIEKDIIAERIKLKKVQLREIEMQQSVITDLVRSDTASLETQRQSLLEAFRKEKLKYVAILKRITESIEKHKVEQSGESSSNRSSDDDADMDNDENLNQKLAELRINSIPRSPILQTSDDVIISKVAHDSSFSPVDLNSRTSATLQEVERNRQNILDQQASRVLEEERDRVKKLKQKVSDEVRLQWEENRRQNRDENCSSIHSVESEGTYSLTSGELPTDTPSSGDETTASECTTMITTPEIHHYDNCQDLINSNIMRDATSTGNANESSEAVKRREKLRSQRPLTRYLPIRQNNFNLKLHIESAGHQLDMCKDSVQISSHSCRGYLHKLGCKVRSWKKRWFVFDRDRHALLYFRDKSETKARRVMYFQDIEEVYVDHQNRVKSPNPGATFCVKTVNRLFFMMAPSPEAMRIWVDVVFTGAEGYQEFMLDMEL